MGFKVLDRIAQVGMVTSGNYIYFDPSSWIWSGGPPDWTGTGAPIPGYTTFTDAYSEGKIVPGERLPILCIQSVGDVIVGEGYWNRDGVQNVIVPYSATFDTGLYIDQLVNVYVTPSSRSAAATSELVQLSAGSVTAVQPTYSNSIVRAPNSGSATLYLWGSDYYAGYARNSTNYVSFFVVSDGSGSVTLDPIGDATLNGGTNNVAVSPGNKILVYNVGGPTWFAL